MRNRVSEGGNGRSEKGEEGRRACIVVKSVSTAWTVVSVAGWEMSDDAGWVVQPLKAKTKRIAKGRKNLCEDM